MLSMSFEAQTKQVIQELLDLSSTHPILQYIECREI